MTDICIKLRELRESYHLTLREMAARTGLSVSYISDIERGRTVPTIKTLEQVASAFELVLCIEFAGENNGVVMLSRSRLVALNNQLEQMQQLISRFTEVTP